MVETARAKARAGALRALNAPEPVRVKTGPQGFPQALSQGRQRLIVATVEDVWRVEDEWWRATPVSRTYFEVLTEDGRRSTLFRDDTDGRWYKQRYE